MVIIVKQNTKEERIRELYEIDNGFFDPCFGSIELPRPEGLPEVFVISACGSGIPVYRRLQKENTPFAAGILYTNDIDYQLARLLSCEVITERPFETIREETLEQAKQCMEKCGKVLLCDIPIGESNRRIEELIHAAGEKLVRV